MHVHEQYYLMYYSPSSDIQSNPKRLSYISNNSILSELSIKLHLHFLISPENQFPYKVSYSDIPENMIHSSKELKSCPGHYEESTLHS